MLTHKLKVHASNMPYVILRLWVGGLYRPFTIRRKKLSEKLRRHLGVAKPTKRDSAGRVSGTSSLRLTQPRGCNDCFAHVDDSLEICLLLLISKALSKTFGQEDCPAGLSAKDRRGCSLHGPATTWFCTGCDWVPSLNYNRLAHTTRIGLQHSRFELFYKADGTVDLWQEDLYDSFLDVLG